MRDKLDQLDARLGARRPRLPHAARRDRGRAGRADQGAQGRARPADGGERGRAAAGGVRRGHRGRARAARRVRRALPARSSTRTGWTPASTATARSAACTSARSSTSRGPTRSRRCSAVAEEVVDLVAEFDGVNSSEHGDGRVRSPFNPRDLRRRALRRDAQGQGAVRPATGCLNPGVMVDAEPLTAAHPRRRAPAAAAPLADPPRRSPRAACTRAADRCQRIGACRKTGSGVMCPSYMATREEEHATRGRANALVKALSRARPAAPRSATSACTRSSTSASSARRARASARCAVDMASLKSEFLSHHNAIHGTPLRSRLFGSIRTLNRLGAATAPLSNLPVPRRAAGEARGDRPPPPAAALRARDADPLATEAARRAAPARGEVVFLADSFTTFTEPGVGRAAIELLEAAGYDVRLESGGCCGRASISKGLLDDAQRQGRGADRAAGRATATITGCRAVLPADAARGARRAARRPRRRRRAGEARRGAAGRGDRRRRAAARRDLGPRPRSSSTATAIRRRSRAPPRRSRC